MPPIWTRGLDLRLTTVADHVPSAHPVLCWRVADIIATSRELAARGVTYKSYPGMTEGDYQIWTSDDGKTRLNWFADPDGNVLGLAQDD